MSASERNAVVRAKSEPLDATPPLQPARNQESPAPLPPGVTWPPGETLPSEETVVADQLYEQPQDDGDEVIDLCDSDDAEEEEEQVGEAGRLLSAIGELGNGCPDDDAEEEEDKEDKELAGKEDTVIKRIYDALQRHGHGAWMTVPEILADLRRRGVQPKGLTPGASIRGAISRHANLFLRRRLVKRPGSINEASEFALCDMVACQGCSKPHDPEKMVLCDGCQAGWHLYCHASGIVEVPPGDWYCTDSCASKAHKARTTLQPPRVQKHKRRRLFLEEEEEASPPGGHDPGAWLDREDSTDNSAATSTEQEEPSEVQSSKEQAPPHAEDMEAIVRAVKQWPAGTFLTLEQIVDKVLEHGFVFPDQATLAARKLFVVYRMRKSNLFLERGIHRCKEFVHLPDLPCAVCRDPGQDDKMLLCERCAMGWHLHCMPAEHRLAAVPKDEWHCWECAKIVSAHKGRTPQGGGGSNVSPPVTMSSVTPPARRAKPGCSRCCWAAKGCDSCRGGSSSPAVCQRKAEAKASKDARGSANGDTPGRPGATPEIATQRKSQCFKVLKTAGLSDAMYSTFVERLDFDSSLELLADAAHVPAAVKPLIEQHMVRIAL
eukprot:jgi/Tetstr1/445941/TSEL_033570.t1